MSFLSRRSVDPLTSTSSTPPKNKAFPQEQSEFHQAQTLRSRARSEASLFRRVSTLFAGRRRTPSKASFSQANASTRGIGHICTLPRNTLPRVSSDSSPASSLEIRRPSGLGRRASLLGSDDSVADSENFEQEVEEEYGRPSPKGYASLPNLLGGTFRLPEERSHSHVGLPLSPPAPAPIRHAAFIFALPDPLFHVVLEFLPRHDRAVVARVCHGFCSAARYALYHSLDVRSMPESSLEKLYDALACSKELAALVVSLRCPLWPSWELALYSIPPVDVHRAFQNMHSLKSLALPCLASMLSRTPSFAFSLTHLNILDEKITRSELLTIRSWLTTQPSLESLSFPRLVEYVNAEPLFVDDRLEADDQNPFTHLLPRLKSLQASTEIILALCFATHRPIERLTLYVNDTLYTGLRPSSVLRTLNGVREMHVIFGPEVDKRTVEKFLGVMGSVLTGEDKAKAMKSLEVEVSWADDDAAETLYGIVTSIISRFRGLETLKLTSPFRSIQAPIPGSVSLSLLPPPSPASSAAPPSIQAASLRSGTVLEELVACGVERSYAKTWTRRCPSLSDVQFDFSCSTDEADVDVELCGVWFRRKVPST